MCFARSMRQVLTAGVLASSLLVGCSLGEKPYPPAVPARFQLPWDNSRSFLLENPPPVEAAPKPAVRLTNLPPAETWNEWRPAVAPVKVCRGKGKRRACTMQKPTAVDAANAMAIVKPSAALMAQGQSIELRFTLDPRGGKLYQFPVSPLDFTRIILPPDEVLAHKLRLDPEAWEVQYGATAEDGARQESVAIRPVKIPLQGRDLLLLKSGLRIYIQPIAQERPGALAVVFTLPVLPTQPLVEPLPLDQQPPPFAADRAYTAYTLKSENKHGVQPPWYPKVVVDDGRNTLIQFGTLLDGQRMPVVRALQQNGKPAMVASRLYQHPAHPEYGSWLYLQGIHPAFVLQDAAGMIVTGTRQPPHEQERVSHDKY